MELRKNIRKIVVSPIFEFCFVISVFLFGFYIGTNSVEFECTETITNYVTETITKDYNNLPESSTLERVNELSQEQKEYWGLYLDE